MRYAVLDVMGRVVERMRSCGPARCLARQWSFGVVAARAR